MYDLTETDEGIERRVADPDEPPASKWWWLVFPLVLPLTLLILLLHLTVALVGDLYSWIKRRR